jgi:heat shock protein HtpX
MDSFLGQEPVLVFDRIDANRRKTFLLLGVFAVLLLPFALYVAQFIVFILGMFILPLLPGWQDLTDTQGLVYALVGFCTLWLVALTAYLVYYNSSRLAQRISGARPLGPGEGGELRRIVENLCIGSGLPPPRLMVLDSNALNALSFGLAPEDATLAVTQGLLKAMDRRELEGVIAQELSQIGNHDILLSTVLATLVSMMISPLRSLKIFFEGPGRTLSKDSGARGCLYLLGGYLAISFLMGLLGLILFAGTPGYWVIFGIIIFTFFILYGAPVICLLIYRAVSREREFLADANAVLLTRNPAGLAQALAKLNVGGHAQMPVNPATANLYIVNPLPAGHRFWDRLLSSHPPVDERINMLGRMGGVTPEMLERAREAMTEIPEAPLEETLPPPGESIPSETAPGAASLPPRESVTKKPNFNSPIMRLLAFWFGIGWLNWGITTLLNGWKEGGRLDDPVEVTVDILLGVFLTAYAVGGQKLVDKIIAQLKRLGLVKDLPPD